ncbi:MAG: NTP pyrophosphohydrolase [Anaerolineaceae bacterium 4572_32.1]|nr:MAG: NTP pyrophosphohydrolase [Anaerolineaceae bacterium 4572_32.1]
MSDDDTTLADLRASVRAFVDERDWNSFHSPKNLSMSIAIEAAELMEEFQWLTGPQSREALFDAAQRQRIGHELADVLIYCLSLANAADIDLSQIVLEKLALNARKYPVETHRGRL